MKKDSKRTKYESLKLTKKQLRTITEFASLSIEEMSINTLQVTVFNMHQDMKKVDRELQKAFVHLQNAMP